MASFLAELKRRHVFKVAAAYAAAAWLLAQIAATVFPVYTSSEEYLRVAFVLLAMGFPVAVLLAWVYDFTPDGIQRTDELPADLPANRVSGRALDFIIIGCLSIAVLFLIMDRLVWNPPVDSEYSSIAVLPFENEQSGVGMEYLGEGISDRLIMRLSRLPGLKVKSRSMLRPGEASSREIGQRLGVDAICYGRIKVIGDILETIVEVVNVKDGSIIWSNRLQHSLATIGRLEGEVSAEIASALSIKLTRQEQAEFSRSPTENAAAYRLYLQGRHFWNLRSEEGLRSSADYYRQAIDLDPGYALAWAGLADSYLMHFAWGIARPEKVLPIARSAITRAIDLDPTLAEPHATLGYYKTLYERDWDGARDAFEESIALNSNYSTAHHWYAFYLSTVGDSSGAIDEILVARDLEPLSPIISAEVSLFLIYDGQYKEAIEELETAMLWNPGFPSLLGFLVRAYALDGQRDKAVEIHAGAKSWTTDNIVGTGFNNIVLPELGLYDEAREYYEYALGRSRTEYVMPGLLGVLAAAIGENDAAFRHFEAGIEERSLVISWLRDPLIAEIQTDPRYDALFEGVGLIP